MEIVRHKKLNPKDLLQSRVQVGGPLRVNGFKNCPRIFPIRGRDVMVAFVTIGLAASERLSQHKSSRISSGEQVTYCNLPSHAAQSAA